jgi:hypothetical protein
MMIQVTGGGLTASVFRVLGTRAVVENQRGNFLLFFGCLGALRDPLRINFFFERCGWWSIVESMESIQFRNSSANNHSSSSYVTD